MNDVKKKIHEKALNCAKNFKKTESPLLEVLMEVEEHCVFRALGFSSLFQYCLECLGLSESHSYQFIGVARKSREVPELKEAIDNGELHLSNARRIVSVLNPKNKKEWIDKASLLSQRELEREIVRVHPKERMKPTLRPISDGWDELRGGVRVEVSKKIRDIQDLESQRTRKACSIDDAIDAMAEAYLEQRCPVRKAKRLCPGIVPPQPGWKKGKGRTRMSNALEHGVNLRDEAQCTHRDTGGGRCQQRRWLGIHHITPISQGGDHRLENLTTLCFHHHRMIHEQKDEAG